MIKEEKDIKNVCVRVDKDMWLFLKKMCISQETNITLIVNKLLDKYRKNIESRIVESK